MTKYQIPFENAPGVKLRLQHEDDVLFKKLDDLLRDERYYLNPTIKKEEICLLVRAKPLNLRHAIKEHGFRNFSHFINHYRVEEAKKMMACESFDIYTVEAIAKMAGFGTRQAFYDAFERLCGVKPACYRRMARRKPVEQPVGVSYKPGG